MMMDRRPHVTVLATPPIPWRDTKRWAIGIPLANWFFSCWYLLSWMRNVFLDYTLKLIGLFAYLFLVSRPSLLHLLFSFFCWSQSSPFYWLNNQFFPGMAKMTLWDVNGMDNSPSDPTCSWFQTWGISFGNIWYLQPLFLSFSLGSPLLLVDESILVLWQSYYCRIPIRGALVHQCPSWFWFWGLWGLLFGVVWPLLFCQMVCNEEHSNERPRGDKWPFWWGVDLLAGNTSLMVSGQCILAVSGQCILKIRVIFCHLSWLSHIPPVWNEEHGHEDPHRDEWLS